MAQIILDWLNSQVELSTQINNIEGQFSNGYLFGELLSKYNQQSNFEKFINSDTKNAKINNFNLLLPVLTNLGIKFDTRIVSDIMENKRGQALRILYQLKMSLEKSSIPSFIKKSDEQALSVPAQKIRPIRKEFDAMEAKFFESRLQRIIKPQKQVLMEERIAKYKEKGKKYVETVKKQLKAQAELEEKIKLEKRKAELNKLKRNAGFMEEWQSKGVKEWTKNIKLKKEREHKQADFQIKHQTKIETFAQDTKMHTINNVSNEIKTFEEKLNKQAVSPKKTVVFDNISPSKTQAKVNPILAKKTLTDKAKKERERRRSKMIVDQAHKQNEYESQSKEQDVIEKMQVKSKQELEMEYEEWRTEQCKNIITENRKLREARFQKRKSIDDQNAITRDEFYLKQMKDDLTNSLILESERIEQYENSFKKYKRSKRSGLCNELIIHLLNTAEEAYIHLQNIDSNNIRPTNMREWTNLFVEWHHPSAISPSAYSNINGKLILPNVELENANLMLDQYEFIDYLKYKGQWDSGIVKRIVIDLSALTPQIPVEVKGGAKKGAVQAQPLEIINPEENKIPETPQMNFHFGDILQRIIDINMKEKPIEEIKQLPTYLKLKLAIIGLEFGGRKTQAKIMGEKYGLKTIILSELIEDAIYEAKVMDNEENIRVSESEAVVKNSLLEKNTSKLAEIGIEIFKTLEEGKSLSDEQLLKLILLKLETLFGFKTPNESKEYLNNIIRNQNISVPQVEPIRGSTPEIIPDSNLEAKDEIEIIEKDETHKVDEAPESYRFNMHSQLPVGFILVGFPETLNQAMLLEKALKGYTHPLEKEPSEIEAEKNKVLEFEEASPKENEKMKMEKSGLDLVLWLNTDRMECARRSIGRRVDPTNDIIYHIEDNPPPNSNKEICEILLPENDDLSTNYFLTDKHTKFEAGKNQLRKWFNIFGDEENQISLCQDVEGNCSADEVAQQISEIIELRLGINKTEIDNMVDSMKAEYSPMSTLSQIPKPIEEGGEIKKQVEEKKEGEFTEEKEDKKLDNQDNQDEKKEEIEEKKVEEVKKTSKSSKEEDDKREEVKKQVEKKLNKYEWIVAKIENIESGMRPVLKGVMDKMILDYKAEVVFSLRHIRIHEEKMEDYVSKLEKSFLVFIVRPDIKSNIILQFIKDYNNFLDENKDMIEDESTKEEMHQRVEDLCIKLFEIIMERKDQANNEMKKYATSGWVEHQLELVMADVKRLFMAEVTRFRMTVRIIKDFYFALEGEPIEEFNPVTFSDPFEIAEIPPIIDPENKESFPLVDFYFKNSLKVQSTINLTSEPPKEEVKKKEAKKDSKKGKHVEDKSMIEEKKLESIEFQKECIDVEKSRLRYKLALIRNWAILKLKEILNNNKNSFEKIQTWINMSAKAESDSINQLSQILDTKIEEESKIEHELIIRTIDLIQREDLLYYLTPPPEPFPAKEIPIEGRFLISQIKSLVTIFSQHMDDSKMIENQVFIEILLTKRTKGNLIANEEGLPQDWNDFSISVFDSIIENLGGNKCGKINGVDFLLFICILKSSVISERDQEDIERKAGYISQSGKLSLEEFLKVPMWYKETEYSPLRPNSYPFERILELQKIIFGLFESANTIDIKLLITKLKAENYLKQKPGAKIYRDLLIN